MKKIIVCLLLPVLSLLAVSAQIVDSWEIQRMQNEFESRVGLMVLEEDYSRLILADAADKIESIKGNVPSQYFVYADRNPKKQMILVCFFDSATRRITIIGADKISTGNPKRSGHFLTPTGVFENSLKNPSYRALGTKNANGWRGFGVKNSRVWDFGWQETTDKNNQKTEIRMLMHATDPDFGEKKLGQVESKGCVRISAKLDKFLDHYGIIDKDYEEHKQLTNPSWLLAADREPVIAAGKYLLIGDSEEASHNPEIPAIWEPLIAGKL